MTQKKPEKMSKRELEHVIASYKQVVASGARGEETSRIPFTKESLKTMRTENPKEYSRLRAEARDTLLKWKLESMIEDLPKYAEDFTLSEHQNWLDKYGDTFKFDVIDFLSIDPQKRELAKAFTQRQVFTIDLDNDFVDLVKDSDKYHMIIAQMQERILSGDDKNAEALQVLKTLEIEPETNPFAHIYKNEFLIGDKLFPVGGVGELFGRSGSLKSFILMDIAFCVAHGIEFNGMPVPQGKVIYIATEDAHSAVNRFTALSAHYRVPIDLSMLRVMDGSAIDLADKSKMRAFSKRLEVFGQSSLMIIDILEKAATGFDIKSGSGWNEMSRNMMEFVKPFVSVICWTAHTPKSNPKVFSGDGNRFNHSDFFYRLDRRANDLKATLVCEKNKNAAKFEPMDFYFKVDEIHNTLTPNHIILKDDDKEILESIKNGENINDAIDCVYLKNGEKTKSAIRKNRSRIKERLNL